MTTAPNLATREILWNVPVPWLMYVLLVPTVVIGIYGFVRRVHLWRLGGSEVRWDRPWQRLGLLLRHGVGQGRTLKQAYAGGFHLLITSGFVVLTIATLVVMLDHDFGTRIMRGGFYLFFQSLTVDLFGALVMVGVGMAAARRWLKKPVQLVHTDEATRILIALFVISATGFLVEGWRIAATDDPWGRWSPVGYLVAVGSESLFDETTLTTGHAFIWWFHCVFTFAFLAWAPYTKMAHIVTAPLNIFFANLDGHAASLRPIASLELHDEEDEEDADEDDPILGVDDLAAFSWKGLLDLDACTECGRCTDACPANTAGKTLSPRDIILDLRHLMHTGAEALAQPEPRGPDDEPRIPILRPESAVNADSLWQCTSCAACMEVCPVYIEQLPKILDVRRFLTMEEAEIPHTMADALTSLERRGHPYPGTQLSRFDWVEGVTGEVPVLSELDDPSDVEVVLWVGCASALIERNHSVVRATAELLNQAGVRFAILGREERCTGDPARRMGNEFLFDTLARKTMATLDRHGVAKGEGAETKIDGETDGEITGKTIVTPCPHCFNSFRNDYPALGGHYAVEHHSTFLEKLVAEGKLQPQNPSGESITFHDPCYLGRYNREFDAPRELVQISTRGETPEMAQSRERSFCCGGGGGMSFADEPPDQRVNRQRAQQALDTGADVVGTGCPFCMPMLEDGVKAEGGDRPPRVQDVAELLWEATRQE